MAIGGVQAPLLPHPDDAGHLDLDRTPLQFEFPEASGQVVVIQLGQLIEGRHHGRMIADSCTFHNVQIKRAFHVG